MTTFRPVGEVTIRFTIDFSHHLHRWQRIQDFLAGMGIEQGRTSSDWERILQMTAGQKERWDKWFGALMDESRTA